MIKTWCLFCRGSSWKQVYPVKHAGLIFLTAFFIIQMYYWLVSVVHRYNQFQKFKLVFLIIDGPGYNVTTIMMAV